MSAEMYGTVVKREKDKYIDMPLYYVEDGVQKLVDISLGNASAFREHINFFIENAADYDKYVKQDENDFCGGDRWDHTYYISLDRLEILKERYAKKINLKKFEKMDDIYDMDENEIIYYMLNGFVNKIHDYLQFADFTYGWSYKEYYFKFQISY